MYLYSQPRPLVYRQAVAATGALVELSMDESIPPEFDREIDQSMRKGPSNK